MNIYDPCLPDGEGHHECVGRDTSEGTSGGPCECTCHRGVIITRIGGQLMRYYTLTRADVGKPHIAAFGQTWPVNGFLGRVMNFDVGKRVYLRGGVLQVENAEQYEARKAHSPTTTFDDDVAWLRFLASWERRASGPPLTTPERDARLMRIAFDWARAHPQGREPRPESKQSWCECRVEDVSDHSCQHRAVLHLFRVTSMVHETPIHDDAPTDFCEPCGDKALESGAFCVGDDLLESHHGPECVKRMYASAGVSEEGGQS